ncbi:integrase, partial [Candidatus Kaiserbacteria bacterium]|nr:integrase [Candidatus Kaiserbacteria bacterium]
AFMLLLRFLEARHGCQVVDLDFVHLSPEDLIAFLEHLETERRNGVSTRNARLAAVHSFARFAATRHPEHLELCQRLLAVPSKRSKTMAVEYLEGNELRAMLDSINSGAADGLRDHALLLTLFNTGARVQEILDLAPKDLQLQRPFQARLRGKGRKERLCPLWPQTVEVIRKLISETGLDEGSLERLFRNHCGEPLTRFGVRYILRKYAQIAQAGVASLAKKRVHPHTLRHSAAVHMLQAGVDLVSISHWLGHASVETTNRYATVDLETKRAAVARAGPIVESEASQSAWRSDESVLTWLESL